MITTDTIDNEIKLKKHQILTVVNDLKSLISDCDDRDIVETVLTRVLKRDVTDKEIDYILLNILVQADM